MQLYFVSLFFEFIRTVLRNSVNFAIHHRLTTPCIRFPSKEEEWVRGSRGREKVLAAQLRCVGAPMKENIDFISVQDFPRMHGHSPIRKPTTNLRTWNKFVERNSNYRLNFCSSSTLPQRATMTTKLIFVTGSCPVLW